MLSDKLRSSTTSEDNYVALFLMNPRKGTVWPGLVGTSGNGSFLYPMNITPGGGRSFPLPYTDSYTVSERNIAESNQNPLKIKKSSLGWIAVGLKNSSSAKAGRIFKWSDQNGLDFSLSSPIDPTSLPQGAALQDFVWSPNGNYLLTLNGSDRIVVWTLNTSTGALTYTNPDDVYTIVSHNNVMDISGDGSFVFVTSTKNVYAYAFNQSTGVLTTPYTYNKNSLTGADTELIAVLPSNESTIWIAAHSQDGTGPVSLSEFNTSTGFAAGGPINAPNTVSTNEIYWHPKSTFSDGRLLIAAKGGSSSILYTTNSSGWNVSTTSADFDISNDGSVTGGQSGFTDDGEYIFSINRGYLVSGNPDDNTYPGQTYWMGAYDFANNAITSPSTTFPGGTSTATYPPFDVGSFNDNRYGSMAVFKTSATIQPFSHHLLIRANPYDNGVNYSGTTLTGIGYDFNKNILTSGGDYDPNALDNKSNVRARDFGAIHMPVAVSPNRKWILKQDPTNGTNNADMYVHPWNDITGIGSENLLFTASAGMSLISFHPSNRSFVYQFSSDILSYKWDDDTGNEIGSVSNFVLNSNLNRSHQIKALDWSMGGDYLLLGSKSSTNNSNLSILAYDQFSGSIYKEIETVSHSGDSNRQDIYRVYMSPNNNEFVATYTKNGYSYVYSISNKNGRVPTETNSRTVVGEWANWNETGDIMYSANSTYFFSHSWPSGSWNTSANTTARNNITNSLINSSNCPISWYDIDYNGKFIIAVNSRSWVDKHTYTNPITIAELDDNGHVNNTMLQDYSGASGRGGLGNGAKAYAGIRENFSQLNGISLIENKGEYSNLSYKKYHNYSDSLPKPINKASSANASVTIPDIHVEAGDVAILYEWAYNDPASEISVPRNYKNAFQYDVNGALWTGTQYVTASRSEISIGKEYINDYFSLTYQNNLNRNDWSTADVNDIVWNGSQYLAVGQYGRVATSSNGVTWTNQTGLRSIGWGTTYDIYSIVWNGSQYVAGAYGGRLASSPDGVNWYERPQLRSTGWGTFSVYDITWNGSEYLIVGPDGKVANSADAVTWTYQTGLRDTAWGTSIDALTVSSNGSQYVVGGQNGYLASSPDSNTWTYNTSFLHNLDTDWEYGTVFDIIWNPDNNEYLAVGGTTIISPPRRAAHVAKSSDGITWTYNKGLANSGWSNTESATSVVWNGSQYLTVGWNGNVANSTDGITWTYQTNLRNGTWGTTYDVNDVVWNGSQYLVVGESGKAANSTDGITWTNQTGLTAAWGSITAISVVWDGSQYVAVGWSGHLANSADGITWTYQDGLRKEYTEWNSGDDVNDVVWNGSQYVAVGADGNIATSPDAVTWTFQDNLLNGTWGAVSDVESIVWNGSQYVAVGSSGKVANSADGITWTYQTGLSSTGWGTTTVYDIVWTGSQYVAVGASGKVANSADGITWTYQTGLSGTGWGISIVESIVWTGSQYVAVGFSGKVATSTDAVTWTYQTGLSSTGWGTTTVYDVVWNGSQYVAVGASGKVATSTDAVTWTYQTGLSSTAWGASNVYDIVWNGSQYVAVGNSGKVATSTDAVTWTYQTGLSSTGWGTSPVYDVVWTGSQYVVVGQDGKVATSTDAVTWTLQDLTHSSYIWGISDAVIDIVWNNNDSEYLVVGENGKVANSYNLIDWTVTSIPFDVTVNGFDTLVKAMWTGSQYVVAGEGGKVATSPNGVDWTVRSKPGGVIGLYNDIYSLVWNGSQHIVGGTGGQLANSSDAITWTINDGLTKENTIWGSWDVNDIIWTGSQYVAVGENCKLATSPDGVTWTYKNALRETELGTLGYEGYSNNIYSIAFNSTDNEYVIGTGYYPLGYYDYVPEQSFNNSRYAKLANSSDLITWTIQDGLSNTDWYYNYSSTNDDFIPKIVVWNNTNNEYLAGGGHGKIANSSDAITWTYQDGLAEVSTIFGSYNIYSIIWTGSQYVAVGQYAKISTSTDGITWTYQNGLRDTGWYEEILDGDFSVYDVVWTGSQYVAVGDSGKVATSTDAVTWTNQTGLSSTGWGNDRVNSIVWTGSQYVAVGYYGKVATSPDAVTWTYQTGLRSTGWGTGDRVESIVWNGSQYVAVGSSGKVATSLDGITWTYQTGLRSTAWGTISTVNDIVWNPDHNLYVAVGSSGKVATSLDGITWSFVTTSLGTINSIVWTGSQYVATGSSGKLGTSPDAFYWTYQTGLSSTDWGTNEAFDIVWSGSQYVAVGRNGRVATSTPNTVRNWTYQDGLKNSAGWGSDTVYVYDVVWNGSQYVAVAQDGRVANSSNAVTWTYQTGLRSTGWGTASDIYSIVWNGSQYVVAGEGGKVATSTDAVTWTYQTGLLNTTFSTNPVNDIIWTGSQYVAVGNSGKVANSTNAVTWTNQTGLSSTGWGTNTVNDIVWTGSEYAIVGANGHFATSPDAVTWLDQIELSYGEWGTNSVFRIILNNEDDEYLITGSTGKAAIGKISTKNLDERPFSFTNQTGLSSTGWGTSTVNNIIWTGSQYVAAGASGKVATSTDAVTWTYQTGLNSPAWGNNPVLSIIWNGSQYVAVSNSGKVATSPDAVNWTYQTGLIDSGWFYSAVISIIWNGSQYVAAGDAGKVATSTDGITWTYQTGLSSTGWGISVVWDIVWTGSQYVVVGASGKVATSTDAVTWTNQTGLSSTGWGTTTVYDIVWNGSQYVAVGDAGKVATSTDGITWTNQTGLSSTGWGTSTVNNIIWTGSQYVAVGDAGKVATSTDAVTWKFSSYLQSTGWGTSDVYDIVWNGSQYVAVGDAGKVATSNFNIIDWTIQENINTETWNLIAANNNFSDGKTSIAASYKILNEYNPGKTFINSALSDTYSKKIMMVFRNLNPYTLSDINLKTVVGGEQVTCNNVSNVCAFVLSSALNSTFIGQVNNNNGNTDWVINSGFATDASSATAAGFIRGDIVIAKQAEANVAYVTPGGTPVNPTVLTFYMTS